ncbi:peptide-methionine (S)-S-oxide reductase [Christensenellaceae bacterium OttesenSCG-928-K19]|nr:peptide-methionine (S)-S-oxide reductase [Christensenellaceae bacterium OttesenSCG-928-K19]
MALKGDKNNMKTIAFSGGGFSGLQRYFSCVAGIEKAQIGYINGKAGAPPSYLDLLKEENGFAEAVMLHYREAIISMQTIAELYLNTIHHREFLGRYGIYYADKEDYHGLNACMEKNGRLFVHGVKITLEPVVNFFPAKGYKQMAVNSDPEMYSCIQRAAYHQISDYY